MWGWRSSSTQPPLSGAVPRTGSRTPTEKGRNARQWPRLGSAEPPSPNTAPERRTAERSAWRVGTHTPHSQTSSQGKMDTAAGQALANQLAGGPCASSPTIAFTAFVCVQLVKFNGTLPVRSGFQNNCSCAGSGEEEIVFWGVFWFVCFFNFLCPQSSSIK